MFFTHKMDSVKSWLEVLICGLVAHPEKVQVTATSDDMGVLFTAKVDPEDNGKIIGKGGNTAKAIRDLLHVAGFGHKLRASLKIDAPDRK